MQKHRGPDDVGSGPNHTVGFRLR